MFTGLVEATGRVRSLRPEARGLWRLALEAETPFCESLKAGDSVCVSGACLTVVEVGKGIFETQMMAETHRRTTLGTLRSGDRVNLERALALGGRLDGHLVQGHVEGIGVLERLEDEGATRLLTFSFPPELIPFLVSKGSVAVDGVSLTVIEAGRERFTVGLIPTTLRETTLQGLKRKDRVNLETDPVGRYLYRFWECRSLDPSTSGKREPSGLNWDKLQQYGWDRGGERS